MAKRASSSVGSGLLCKKPVADIIRPGMQKPHWRPPCSIKARCTGDKPSAPGRSPAASPSMVVMSASWAL